MSKPFHAVKSMRKAREAMDREAGKKGLRSILQRAHKKVSQDPSWKTLLNGVRKKSRRSSTVKGA